MMLDYLKENTKSIHQAVEKDSLAKYIIQHNISRDNYQIFLIQNFKFYYSIEQALIRQRLLINPSFHPFLTEIKSQSLAKDLSTLSYDVPALKSKINAYQIDSQDAAIGALYVSEGSALGGLIIGKHLNDCPDLAFISTHYFFGMDKSAILSRWKDFRQAVTSYSPSVSNQEEVLEAAKETFQFFGRIMNE